MKPERDDGEDCSKAKGNAGAAFLLAQLGAHAAAKFAERLEQLHLTPAHAGIFRILSATPAISQQALATALGTVPSRLVGLIDELESKGLSNVARMRPIDAAMRYI
jgi:DNA-binding MarR family transcriptional regulator